HGQPGSLEPECNAKHSQLSSFHPSPPQRLSHAGKERFGSASKLGSHPMLARACLRAAVVSGRERLHGLALEPDGPRALSPGCILYWRNQCTPGWLASSRSTSKKCCLASANWPCWARVTPKL